jgi:hypothetical protein
MVKCNSRKLGAAIGVTGVMALAGAVSVSAHANAVNLVARCAAGSEVITATITNDFNLKETVTIQDQKGAIFSPSHIDIGNTGSGTMTAPSQARNREPSR